MEELVNKRFDEHRKRQGLTVEEVNVDTGDDTESGQSSPLTLTTTTTGDKSRKGSVDTRILHLTTLINATDNFFTTSTCSGRIILFANEKAPQSEHSSTDSKKIKKKGCKWLLVSHEQIKEQELLEALKSGWDSGQGQGQGDVSFKVEAAILHVQCRRLSDAKKLIETASSGFRNSGMIIGRDNRITVAIRSTLGMEVPLVTYFSDQPQQQPLITEKYLSYLVLKANEKMIENWRRLDKMAEEFKKTFVGS